MISNTDMIKMIAIRFAKAAGDLEADPYRATDGMTDSLKTLKAGRELGRQMLGEELKAKGWTEEKSKELFKRLGI